MTTPEFDLLIKNVRVVRPHGNVVHDSDIAIKDGQFALVAPGIDVARAKKVHDGQHRLAFPGVVDAHMHSGIYSPLFEDAVSESKAAAMGGVTSSLNYFRTGQYYLNKGGPYKKFYPEVLKTSKGRFHVDYGFHLAPMDGTHIMEIPELIEKFGVSSFKIFMFYGSHGLHGASNAQRDFLMIGEDERYDYGHFEFVMRGIQAAREQMPERARQISLSLHCETAEVMTAWTKIIEKDKSQKGGTAQALCQDSDWKKRSKEIGHFDSQAGFHECRQSTAFAGTHSFPRSPSNRLVVSKYFNGIFRSPLSISEGLDDGSCLLPALFRSADASSQIGRVATTISCAACSRRASRQER